MSKKDKILILRSQNFTYDQIAELVPCSKSLVAFHCNPATRTKAIERTKKYRQTNHPFKRKLENFRLSKKRATKKIQKDIKKAFRDKIRGFFRERKGNRMATKPTFTLQDVINKFGNNPKCYLTGQPIDIMKPDTYHFDHIIPVSKGGENTLDNLEIAVSTANFSKGNLLLEEYIELCKSVLTNFGYKINQ